VAGIAVAVGLALGAAPAAAQGVLFCLNDGLQVRADRFEARDGRFILWVAGSANPIEYPANAVRGINVPCPTAPAVTPARLAPSQPAVSHGMGFGIHGSNTIGERMMPLLIEAYSTRRFGARPAVKLVKPEEQEITLQAADGQRTVVYLQSHGSGTSAKGLLAGTALIGMSSRRATDDEARQLREQFQVDIRSPGSEHVLALDGLAVIVNPANRVRQLTLDQIAQIFAGQIVNWRQLGGDDLPIRAHRRDDKSGTYDTFNALVLAPRKLKPAATVAAYESSENLSDEVSRDPAAIGFIGLPFVNRNIAVGINATCGIASRPSTFAIKTESYPLARRLYLYTIGQPAETRVRNLLAFTLSDEAQPTITEAGFVEQSIELQSEADQAAWVQSVVSSQNAFLAADKQVPAEARTQLARLAAAAHRTSAVLRFDSGSAVLDTRAQQDVARISRWLRSPVAAGKRFWIVGFADSDGNWLGNLQLGLGRAGNVARALQSVGVPVQQNQLVSMSYLAPSDCNDSDGGKNKNRRVELWLQR
jgi:phosphate transport system substrate-binding protein